jgi:hypothetical protein
MKYLFLDDFSLVFNAKNLTNADERALTKNHLEILCSVKQTVAIYASYIKNAILLYYHLDLYKCTEALY